MIHYIKNKLNRSQAQDRSCNSEVQRPLAELGEILPPPSPLLDDPQGKGCYLKFGVGCTIAGSTGATIPGRGYLNFQLRNADELNSLLRRIFRDMMDRTHVLS